MADFGGFEATSVQEALAGLQNQQQQIQQMRPDARRNANIQFQIANMFGGPELKKARTLEKSMDAVNTHITNNPESDPIQAERRRLAMMFDVVKDSDPSAAAQITQAQLNLENEAEERDRLNAADARSERNTVINEGRFAIEEEKYGRLPDWSTKGFTVDPNSKDQEPQMYDLSDPAQAAEYNAAAENGLMQLDQEQAVDMIGQQRMRDKMTASFNKGIHGDRVAGYTAQATYLKQGRKLLERFRVNPTTGTLALDVGRGIRNLAAEGKAIAQTLQARDGSDYSEGATKGYIRNALDAAIENENLQISETQRSLYESAILNMGYVLARSLDSGGRLSDQDVNMAIRMLTGGSAIFEDGTISVPAEQIAAVMLDRAADINGMLGVDSPDEILFTADAAANGDVQAQQIRGLRQLNRDLYSAFQTSSKSVLGEDLYQRVVNPYEAVSDEEQIEINRADKQAEATEAVRQAGQRFPIFRPDSSTEKSIPNMAAIIYDEAGEVVEVVDTIDEWKSRIGNLPDGYRLRFKDQRGKMQETGLGQ